MVQVGLLYFIIEQNCSRFSINRFDIFSVRSTRPDSSSKSDGEFLLLGFLTLDILAIREKTELISEVLYCRFIGSMKIPEGNTSFCSLFLFSMELKA